MEHESTARRLRDRGTDPLVSILVVVYQAAAELSPLVDSILAHRDDDVELIVIDGGSQDGTTDYLHAHSEQIDYLLSEPDQGIYDAMNKAAAKARGTYLLHLNAGDRLLRIPKDELKQAKRDSIDVAAFRVSIDGRTVFTPSVGFALRFTNTLHHQGTFFRRERFLPYDLKYRVFADFDVNQRLALAGARMKTFKAVVAFHANDGVSNQNPDAIQAEFLRVVRNNQGSWAVPFARLLRKWHGLQIMLKS